MFYLVLIPDVTLSTARIRTWGYTASTASLMSCHPRSCSILHGSNISPSVHSRQLLVFKYDQYHPNPWSLTSVSCQSLRLRFPNWAWTSSAISITHSLQGLWHQLHINPGNALVLLPQAPHQEPQIPQVRSGRWKEGVKAGRSDLGKEEYLK